MSFRFIPFIHSLSFSFIHACIYFFIRWLTCWFTDSLVHWFSEALNHWFFNSLIHWLVELLYHLFVGSLIPSLIYRSNVSICHWCWNAESLMIHLFIYSFIHWIFEALIHWLTALPWFSDSLLHTASVIHWFIESLGHSLTGSFNHWFKYSLTRCFTGSLSGCTWLHHWFIDLLLHWFIEFIHWFIDSLAHQFIASFIQSCNDSFMSCRWHLNNHVLIRWCTSQLQHFIASASQKLYRPLISYSHVLFSILPPRRVPGSGWYALKYCIIVYVPAWALGVLEMSCSTLQLVG